MVWPSTLPRSWITWVAVLVIGVLTVQVASAQEPPPFPFLYGGAVLIDGAPAVSGTSLVARVGDWKNTETIRDGGFYGIMVAPPDKSYYLKPITFEVNGMTAKEQDVFLPGNGPTFKDQGYVLHFASQPLITMTPTVVASPIAPQPTATPTQTGRSRPVLLGLVLGGVLVMGASLVWYSLRRRG